jgi:DNA-binding NarL/FixJ family response regulator
MRQGPPPSDSRPTPARYTVHPEQFADLMAFRVREILLVASEYDAFVLEEGGQLAELVVQEYRNLELNPRYAPQVTRTENGADALRLLAERRFDLVVTTAGLKDVDLPLFGRQVKSAHPTLAVGVLAAHAWELPRLEGLRDRGDVDWIFLWQGDVKSLFALIKQVEDRRNADHDVLERGVQAVLLVEDDPRFASFLLPRLYAEITRQTSLVMKEGLNISHRLLRLRARPKILLCGSYEEALALYERYAANVLGVISDLAFPRDGRSDPEAGFALAEAIRQRDPDVSILLQSAESSARGRAARLRAAFLDKNSPTLLEQLRRYIVDNYGFGEFTFRLPDGKEVGKAADLRELLPRLEKIPDESVEYHARRNHFSRWLLARTEFELAADLRPVKVSHFPSIAELRRYLCDRLIAYLHDVQRHVISDFDEERFDEFVGFARIGTGSLGGKGRGLAFMHKLLAENRLALPGGVEVEIPQTVVLGADVFAQYLERNRVHPRVLEPRRLSDVEILDAFRRGRFRRPVRARLAAFLEVVNGPLAVRSSSILEDSIYQPFAGVYATVMLPNVHPSLDVRLAQLLEAIKVVYASTYVKAARDYLEATPHRLEEEQMAVLVQRLVGTTVDTRFYPALSGVAGSHNFYPFGPMQARDGVAHLALGLGKSVVEGIEALRFCPAHPEVLPQLSTVEDVLRNAQRKFWALDLSRADLVPGPNPDAALIQLETTVAIADGMAEHLLSTHLAADDAIVPGLKPGGVPLVTFAPVLRGRVFPLPEVLVRVLRAAEDAMGVPVEIEFAVGRVGGSGPATLHVLQLRPTVAERAQEEGITLPAGARVLVSADRALGNGRKAAITDIIAVRPDCQRGRTAEVAAALERINAELRRDGRGCVLVGPGRWGSADPWIGIPVSWSQISTAKAIVETDFADLEVEPSAGSHFFHNLTAFGIAFLSVSRREDNGSIDWDWLTTQSAIAEAAGGAVRHIRPSSPVRVIIDGASRQGVIAVEA